MSDGNIKSNDIPPIVEATPTARRIKNARRWTSFRLKICLYLLPEPGVLEVGGAGIVHPISSRHSDEMFGYNT